ncbi:unnamed protein product [Paramecium octaurelia]|uniref:Uncharacterized protein n=1 Tax=Paramecium octaurelia TaxID=43137 RepID=A0A8S1WVD1_PAROT|nr:unnamed protein product [Paramecium octaurelia]
MNSSFRISSTRRSSGCKSECEQHFQTTNELLAKKPKDKEKLEETVILLKMQINLLNDENVKLRFEIQHLQKQIAIQEKTLQMNKNFKLSKSSKLNKPITKEH